MTGLNPHIKELIAERAKAEDRLMILNSRSLSILQYMIILVGVGMLAFSRERTAILVVPLLWSVWFLYAHQVDRDSIQWVEYIKLLEKEILLSGTDFGAGFQYRSGLDLVKPDFSQLVVYNLAPAYAAMLNVFAWFVSFHVLQQEKLSWWFLGAYIGTGIVVNGGIIIGALGRESHRRRVQEALKQQAAGA